jgi:hypothetical protein
MSTTADRMRARIQARRAARVIVTPEPVAAVVEAPESEDEEEVSYRDLQEQAKALEIPANQSADELKAAIAEATEE